MAKQKAHLDEELGTLQAELRKAKPRSRAPGRSEPAPAPADSPSPVMDSLQDLEASLRELGEAVSVEAGSVEKLIAAHPLASVVTAFALGVAVGQLFRKSSHA